VEEIKLDLCGITAIIDTPADDGDGGEILFQPLRFLAQGV